MQLIDLKPRLSLEFDRDQLSSVLRKLRRYGPLSREECATFDVVHLGGESFLLEGDMGEIALISRSLAGDALLRRIFTSIRRFSAREQRLAYRERGEWTPIRNRLREAA